MSHPHRPNPDHDPPRPRVPRTVYAACVVSLAVTLIVLVIAVIQPSPVVAGVAAAGALFAIDGLRRTHRTVFPPREWE